MYLKQLPIVFSPKSLPPPLISPSYSANFAFGRPEDSLKDRERDKDREKSDAELSAVRRNAAKLLELHEALSPMLADAVRASGWTTGLNVLEGTEDVGSEPDNDDGDAEERFESALRNVAELFTTQVSLQSNAFILFPCWGILKRLHFRERLLCLTCTRFSVRNTLARSKP